MSNMELIRGWLTTFPGWKGEKPVLDRLDVLPGSCGLFYLGMSQVKHLADVTGSQSIRCRYQFSLCKVLERTEPATLWLEDFERWVMEQSLFSGTPVLSGCVCPCEIRAEKSRLEVGKQTGTAVYSVNLIVECVWQCR